LLRTGDLPDDLKNDLQNIQTKLKRTGTFQETIAGMITREADAVANEIVALYGQMWFHTGKLNRDDVCSMLRLNAPDAVFARAPAARLGQ
jgi:hypothetical protein